MTTIVSKQALAVAALALGIQAMPAIAEPVTMTCKNATRSYFVKFDRKARTFFANDTKYTVLAVEDAAGKLIVAGSTVNGGPSFRAELRPRKSIRFFVDERQIQTDVCH